MFKKIKDIAEILIFAFIAIFLILRFVLLGANVSGGSMQPTLQDGDTGYSFKITKNIKINRFDIAVVELEDKLIVKRVIGIPNDSIEYKDNVLYINGEEYEEEYLAPGTITEDFFVELKDDEYYCLGDHREISLDSRNRGAFTSEQIISTHLFVLTPIKDFGFKK